VDIELRGQPAGLAYKLLTSLVVPRPIAWVSSQDPAGGINLAPFSFFNVMGAEPPIVVIGVGNGPDGRPKHTGQNIEATREFVVNLVTEELIAAMNLTAADFPAGQSELDAAGLHAAPSRLVSVPRVAEARASLECVLQSFQRIGANNVIIGEVVALHLADGLADDRLRVQNFTPIGRMGTPAWYTRTEDRFELPRLTWAEAAKVATGAAGGGA
jgi:flavin reductase (DIM6/NTAB) family NADH-FMN oxidoreductase RutF